MVRENRVKDYTFSSADLTGIANGSPNSYIDVYSDHTINGQIQSIFWKAGNHIATGSLFIRASGLGDEGTILSCLSGTTSGHHLAENWIVFPIATTVRTDMTPVSGANGYDEFSKLSVNSIIRVVASGVGVNKSGGQLSITYV